MKFVIALSTAVICLAGTTAAQTPQILSVLPTQNELNVAVNTNISATFDIDMNETTINESTFIVFGLYTGMHGGTITYDSPTNTAVLDPQDYFEDGEIVTAVLTAGIQSSGGTPLASGYTWSFTAVAAGGSGTFTQDSAYNAGSEPTSICVADYDGDGDMDLATANRASDSVAVLSNNGYGLFALESSYLVGFNPWGISAADLNMDNNIDLAVACRDSGEISILLNNGDGTFAVDSTYSIENPPVSLSAADLDGDGDIDLATASLDSNNISIFLNSGAGIFSTASTYPVGTTPWGVYSADLDGDGDLDLTTSNRG